VNLSVSLSEDDVERIAQRVVALSADGHGSRDPWLDVDEAAEYLRCSRQRIYDLASTGRLAAGKDGRRSLFRQSVLNTYLEEEA